MTAGRPLKFKTVQELQKKIDEYFNTTPFQEWTITGLALHLDTFRVVLIDYGSGKYDKGDKKYTVTGSQKTDKNVDKLNKKSYNPLIQKTLKDIERRVEVSNLTSKGKKAKIQYRWQEAAKDWTTKLKITKFQDSTRLFGLFKEFKDNEVYMTRLCTAAYDANARNPIAYILAIIKKDNERNKV